MSLSIATEVDQIKVTLRGIVMIREVKRILQGSESISESYRRYSLSPGDDLSNQPKKVQDICNAAWTSEVIAAYKDDK